MTFLRMREDIRSDSKPMSGPDLRFLTHQVASDFSRLLQTNAQGTELDEGAKLFFQEAPQNQLLLLRYDGKYDRRLSTKVL